jgi:hypothetical protein
MDKTENPREKVVATVRGIFFLEFDRDQFLSDLDTVCSSLSVDVKEYAGAFRQNLQATISVLGLPDTLAIATAQRLRFRQLHIAERIRRLPIEGEKGSPESELSEQMEEEALRSAHERFEQEARDPVMLRALRRESVDCLVENLQFGELQLAAPELLRQGAVLAWSAFEVLSRDLFVLILNKNPQKAKALVEHLKTRKKFDLRMVSIDILAEHGFDISSKMGSVLVQSHDLGDLGGIKDAYQTLFPDLLSLHDALNQKDLWLLNQRRHLIVHKRAVVDEHYRRSTAEDLPVGSLLQVFPVDLKRYLQLVREAGLEILKAADSTLSQSAT